MLVGPVWQKRINDAWNGQDWILPGTNCHIRIYATISINDSNAVNQILLGETGTSWLNYKGPNGYGEGRWYFTAKEPITGVHHDGGDAVAHEVGYLMGIQLHSSDSNNFMGGFDKSAALGDVLQALGTINMVQCGGRFDFFNGCGCKK
jgi:hypothetical protein